MGQGCEPDKFVTDDLRSYGAAARDLGISRHHERGRWCNNRAENSHQGSPTISVRPRRHLQRLQRPAALHLSKDAPGISSPRPCGRGARSPLRRERDLVHDLPRLWSVNVTMPALALAVEQRTIQPRGSLRWTAFAPVSGWGIFIGRSPSDTRLRPTIAFSYGLFLETL
jgi:hypothetical protein